MGNKPYEKDEQAKWAKAVEETAAAYLKATDEGLDKDAARGLCAPAGDTMMTVLNTAHEAKGKIVDALGEVFQKQNERIIQMDEVDKKLLIGRAKLRLEKLKADLTNLLELETAQMEANLLEQKVDIDKRLSMIERRQAMLITMKADIEHQVNAYKKMAIEAEGITLDSRVMLAQAELETAREKLKIIDAINQQIAAEELVLVAEQRKQAALQIVIAAEKRLYEVKQDLIPMLENKAEAREEQAEAIEEEMGWKRAIVELGYTKNAIEVARESAEQTIREAENDYHTAQLAYARAQEAANIARHASQVTMKNNATAARTSAIAISQSNEQMRASMRIDKEVYALNLEAQIAFAEQAAHVAALSVQSQDDATTELAGTYRQVATMRWHNFGRRIIKGSF